MRARLDIDPPGKQKQRRRKTASNADQNPRNGPKENAKKNRSWEVTPAAPRIWTQFCTMQSQLSAVSSHRIGTVVVPLVWWQRTYWSNGKVRLVPYGGCSSRSRTISCRVVNGTSRWNA